MGGALVCNLAVTGMGMQPGSDPTVCNLAVTLLCSEFCLVEGRPPTEFSTYCFCSVLCGVVSLVVSNSGLQPGSDRYSGGSFIRPRI